MSTVLDIPAQEAHVVRVFAVVEEAGAPLVDAAVLEALGAEGKLRSEEIELFDLTDLQDMPLSAYLTEGHGIAASDIRDMRGQLDGLTGRVLILPSRAFQGQAMKMCVGAALRLVGRFEEERAPVRFAPLPAGGAAGAVSPGGESRPRRAAGLAALVFFVGLAVLAALVLWLAGGR